MDSENDGYTVEEEEVDKAAHSARLDLSKMRREDGLLTRAGPISQSLLHRLITAVEDNRSYRQELKIARWSNTDEADDAVAALEECLELGMDPTPIIDQIIARSSGQNHQLLSMVIDGLTHTTFTTNYQKGNRQYGKPKGGPLS
jgi:hypothetical protein